MAAGSDSRIIGGIRTWLNRRGYHLLFALAILCLTALIAWWAVFIRNSIERIHDLHHDNMYKSALALSAQMNQNAENHPSPGLVAEDRRLEIVQGDAAGIEDAVSLGPAWPEMSIVPSEEYHTRLEDKFRRQIIMVMGEGSLLLLVILVSIFMLWRTMRIERRSRRELHEFWGRVTHELKTPITGIKAFLQTIQQRAFTHEELKPLVKLALGEVERQEMLAENLLLGQRLDQKEFAPAPRKLNVVRFVSDFIDEHRMILPDENLKFVHYCPAETVAMADPDALRVILENLTDNALKYGGKNPELTYEIAAREGRVRITISDKGVGFDPANSDQIFEAYMRLSEEQPKGKHGTGLGLYLSRQLARKMGGDLRASSPGANQGASFIISLRSS